MYQYHSSPKTIFRKPERSKKKVSRRTSPLRKHLFTPGHKTESTRARAQPFASFHGSPQHRFFSSRAEARLCPAFLRMYKELASLACTHSLAIGSF